MNLSLCLVGPCSGDCDFCCDLQTLLSWDQPSPGPTLLLVEHLTAPPWASCGDVVVRPAKATPKRAQQEPDWDFWLLTGQFLLAWGFRRSSDSAAEFWLLFEALKHSGLVSEFRGVPFHIYLIHF